MGAEWLATGSARFTSLLTIKGNARFSLRVGYFQYTKQPFYNKSWVVEPGEGLFP